MLQDSRLPPGRTEEVPREVTESFRFLSRIQIVHSVLCFAMRMFLSFPASLALVAGIEAVKNTQPNLQARSSYSPVRARQLPANTTGLKTITTPQNVTIRYKEPGKEGVCETTPGVNSYSGYIDLSPTSHTFFWFFEARNNPKEAPIF